MLYLVHIIGYIMNSDIWLRIRNLQRLRLVDLLGYLVPLPPLLVHALLPPQQLPHVCPA